MMGMFSVLPMNTDYMTDKKIAYFYFIVTKLNLNSHVWQVDIVLNSIDSKERALFSESGDWILDLTTSLCILISIQSVLSAMSTLSEAKYPYS